MHQAGIRRLKQVDFADDGSSFPCCTRTHGRVSFGVREKEEERDGSFISTCNKNNAIFLSKVGCQINQTLLLVGQKGFHLFIQLINEWPWIYKVCWQRNHNAESFVACRCPALHPVKQHLFSSVCSWGDNCNAPGAAPRAPKKLRPLSQNGQTVPYKIPPADSKSHFACTAKVSSMSDFGYTGA